MSETKNLLEREIESQIQNLSVMESGSQEKASAVEDLTKLYKLKIEETKIDKEYEEKWHNRAENQVAFEEDSKYKKLRLVLDAVGITAPLVFYGVWMSKGLKFEETGAFTSSTFRGLISKFKPTK